MKLSMLAHPKRDVPNASSKRVEWSWCGFGAVLLVYVVASAALGLVPDQDLAQGAWFAVGLLAGLVGLCVGFALAELRQ